MKKTFITALTALTLMATVGQPVYATDYLPSPNNSGVTVATTTGTTSSGKEVAISGDLSKLDSGTSTIVVSSVANTTNALTKEVYSKLSKAESNTAFINEYDGLASKIENVTGANATLAVAELFDLSATDAAKTAIGDDGTVKITLNISTVVSGRNYLAIHFVNETDTEIIPCEVGDGTITLTMGNKFSPILLVSYVKAETKEDTSTDTGKKADSKVVTCEEAHGKNWIWSEKKQECVYSVSNTSVK